MDICRGTYGGGVWLRLAAGRLERLDAAARAAAAAAEGQGATLDHMD